VGDALSNKHLVRYPSGGSDARYPLDAEHICILEEHGGSEPEQTVHHADEEHSEALRGICDTSGDQGRQQDNIGCHQGIPRQVQGPVRCESEKALGAYEAVPSLGRTSVGPQVSVQGKGPRTVQGRLVESRTDGESPDDGDDTEGIGPCVWSLPPGRSTSGAAQIKREGCARSDCDRSDQILREGQREVRAVEGRIRGSAGAIPTDDRQAGQCPIVGNRDAVGLEDHQEGKRKDGDSVHRLHRPENLRSESHVGRSADREDLASARPCVREYDGPLSGLERARPDRSNEQIKCPAPAYSLEIASSIAKDDIRSSDQECWIKLRQYADPLGRYDFFIAVELDLQDLGVKLYER